MKICIRSRDDFTTEYGYRADTMPTPARKLILALLAILLAVILTGLGNQQRNLESPEAVPANVSPQLETIYGEDFSSHIWGQPE
jgi:hypothetical protein